MMGDLINKSPNYEQTLKLFKAFSEKYNDNLHFILGNHELLLTALIRHYADPGELENFVEDAFVTATTYMGHLLEKVCINNPNSKELQKNLIYFINTIFKEPAISFIFENFFQLKDKKMGIRFSHAGPGFLREKQKTYHTLSNIRASTNIRKVHSRTFDREYLFGDYNIPIKEDFFATNKF